MNGYFVPRETIRIEHRVKNSRFIATAGAVASAEEAKAFVQRIREEMPDATHHVYAFRIGSGASVTEGMSDDGEPSGTSGPPVLSVLRGSGVGDVVVVVSRYFGGTKLGTGGLVSAYSDSAKLVMERLPVEEKLDKVRFSMVVPYTYHNQVQRVLQEYDVRDVQETFVEHVVMKGELPVSKLEPLTEAIHQLSNGMIEIQKDE